MGLLTVNTFVTLDGIMQAPGGPDEDRSGGFAHGGWSAPFWNDEMGATIGADFAKLDALLLGRGTYDIFAAHWPRVPADDPAGAVLNRVPKYVVTDTLERADWNNSTIVRGRDLVATVAKLKERYANDVQVHGSAGLLQTLFRERLVDELRLLVYPITLGSGKRLFEHGVAPTTLRLTRSQTFGNGVVALRYERAGVPSYGSFALDPEQSASGAA